MNKTHYEVTRERCYDGLGNWQWTLWIDDYAWDGYATEAEAWAEAERLAARIDIDQLNAR